MIARQSRSPLGGIRRSLAGVAGGRAAGGRAGDDLQHPLPRAARTTRPTSSTASTPGSALPRPRPPLRGRRDRDRREQDPRPGAEAPLRARGARSSPPARTPPRSLAAAGPRAVLLDLPLDETEALVTAPKASATTSSCSTSATPTTRCVPRTAPRPSYSTYPSRVDAGRRHGAVPRRARLGRVCCSSPAPIRRAWPTPTPSRPPPAKFGLEIADRRPFELTNDPRRRELSNVALLTGGVDYDVVYVADAVGEFARFVPYATYSAAAGGRQRRASGRWPGTGAWNAPAPRSSTSASPARRPAT